MHLTANQSAFLSALRDEARVPGLEFHTVEVLSEEERTANSLAARGLIEMDGWEARLPESEIYALFAREDDDDPIENGAGVADELEKMQAVLNGGRGVTVVRSIVAALRRGDIRGATAEARTDHDKLWQYPDLRRYVELRILNTAWDRKTWPAGAGNDTTDTTAPTA